MAAGTGVRNFLCGPLFRFGQSQWGTNVPVHFQTTSSGCTLFLLPQMEIGKPSGAPLYAAMSDTVPQCPLGYGQTLRVGHLRSSHKRARLGKSSVNRQLTFRGRFRLSADCIRSIGRTIGLLFCFLGIL